MYPPDWPRCPNCGDYALDGKLTCGRWQCQEAMREAPDLHYANAALDAALAYLVAKGLVVKVGDRYYTPENAPKEDLAT